MRRVAVFGVVAMGALVAPLLASGTALRAGTEQRADPVLGLVHTYAGFTTNDWSVLTRLDARTLEPTGRAHVTFQPPVGDPAYSPDRTRLALVDESGRIFVVDTSRLRVIRSVRKAVFGETIRLAWIGRYLLDFSSRGDSIRGFVLDPSTLGVVARTKALPGRFLAAGTTATGVVVLLAPSARQIGDCVVAAVSAAGVARSIGIPGTRCGWDDAGHQAVPGLAVDAVGDRAFVVPGDSPIAEVDLRTMAVSTHALVKQEAGSAAPLGRPAPAAQAKTVPAGPARSALWLGGGTLAFWGADFTGSSNSGTPVDVTLVDTRSWVSQSLGPADWVARAGDELVTSGRDGLGVYGTDGKLRFRLFPGREVYAFQVGYGHAIVTPVPVSNYWVVDLSRGKIMRTGPGDSVPELVDPAVS